MPAKKTAKPNTKKTTSAPSTVKSSEPAKTNTLSVVAIILTFILFTIPIVGLILGIIALVQIKKSNEGGKGLAISSIVISSILLVLQVVFLILVVSLASFGNGFTNSKRSFTYNKNGNSFSIGTNVSLPNGFPSDVPIYPGSKIKLSTTTDKGNYTVTLTSSDNQQKVADYYKQQMQQNGWTADNEQDMGEIGQMNGVGTYTKGSNKTNVVVLQNQKDQTTTVFITVSKTNNEAY